ncbi:MAG: hypothetical protein ACI843_000282 [Psychrobacter glaciei]|jgi:hypothetical protein
MINPAGKSLGFEYTLADSYGSSIPNTEKKTLPTMGHATECHMELLFKPNTFDKRLEALSRPIISDTNLLNPSQFNRIGVEARQLLSDMSTTTENLMSILSNHQDNESMLSVYRNLLIHV